MSSSSDSDHDDTYCPSDADSETSTVAYSHESFATYQTRVLDLVRALYGSETAKSAQIARRTGGGFNRIIGIILSFSPVPTNSEDLVLRMRSTHPPVGGGIEMVPSGLDLILRIPRFDRTDVAVQVSLLHALRPSLPVPVIEHYDECSDNALGQPYILMRRLPGHSLHDTLPNMTTDERCQIAKQVAQLIVTIHAIPLPHNGIGPLSADDTGQLRIMQFPVDPEDDEFDGTESPNPPPMTFHSFVSTRIAELRAHAQMHGPPNKFRLKLLDRLSSASSTLLDAYTLPNPSIALFHRDFAARNILVVHNKDKARWSISGVLDWDECEAAPLEISTVWPGWLWASDEEGEADFDENAWDPDLPVPNDRSERIKKSFVDEIEKLKPGFLEMVRRTRDGCLRLVYERARGGFFSNEHVKELDQIEEAARKLTKSSAQTPLDFVIVEKLPLPDDSTPAEAPPPYSATIIVDGPHAEKSGFNHTKMPMQPEISFPCSPVSHPFNTAPGAAVELVKKNIGKSASNNWFSFNIARAPEIRDTVLEMPDERSEVGISSWM